MSDIYTHPDPAAMVNYESVVHRCPDCGTELEFVHHPATFAYPECYVPLCPECSYTGDPE